MKKTVLALIIICCGFCAGCKCDAPKEFNAIEDAFSLYEEGLLYASSDELSDLDEFVYDIAACYSDYYKIRFERMAEKYSSYEKFVEENGV